MKPLFRQIAYRVPLLKDILRAKEENRFLLSEVRKLNEALRTLLSENPGLRLSDQRQTTESFDYQWNHVSEGNYLPSDRDFMRTVTQEVVASTGLPAEWFPGKKVIDIGCGIGRFSYGLLKLGAHVTSVDQSEWACRRTAETCREFAARSVVKQMNLLDWPDPADFDLAFSFGVVHHTGRTYRAIENVAAKVGPKGHLFLMVYGFPVETLDFFELNLYEGLREELRALPLAERHAILTQRFGPALAHGYFDAVSPKINDLLTFEELREFLQTRGFTAVKRTVNNRNLHISAQRR